MFIPGRRLTWVKRFKFQSTLLIGGFLCLTVFQTLVSGEIPAVKYAYNGHNYKQKDSFEFPRGEMVVFYDSE